VLGIIDVDREVLNWSEETDGLLNASEQIASKDQGTEGQYRQHSTLSRLSDALSLETE
jgi:hypothetical protein